MSPNEFDRSLMEDLSQLPPAPGEVESYRSEEHTSELQSQN